MKIFTKTLTGLFFLGIYFLPLSHASVFSMKNFKTHLRWNVQISKEDIEIKKVKNGIQFQTLNINIFNQLNNDLNSSNLPQKYFKKVVSSAEEFPDDGR